jgi:hypothetical protein
MFKLVLRKSIDSFDRGSNDDTDYIRHVIHASPRTTWPLARFTHTLATAVLVAVFALASQAAAQVSEEPSAVSVYTFTPERMAATVAAVVGLISAVIGGMALARSSAGRTGTSNGRRGAIAALVMGPVGLVIGGLVVITSDGGLGTGNGLGGGVVAMLVGLIGIALGGLARTRSRRTG